MSKPETIEALLDRLDERVARCEGMLVLDDGELRRLSKALRAGMAWLEADKWFADYEPEWIESHKAFARALGDEA